MVLDVSLSLPVCLHSCNVLSLVKRLDSLLGSAGSLPGWPTSDPWTAVPFRTPLPLEGFGVRLRGGSPFLLPDTPLDHAARGVLLAGTGDTYHPTPTPRLGRLPSVYVVREPFRGPFR